MSVLTLDKGGHLYCDTLFFDYTLMTSFFSGTPQLTYSDTMGEIYASRLKSTTRK